MRKLMAPITTLIVGMALGIGTVAIADEKPPQGRVAADPILSELKNISKRLDLVNKNLGGYQYIAPGPPIQALLEDIERNTAP